MTQLCRVDQSVAVDRCLRQEELGLNGLRFVDRKERKWDARNETEEKRTEKRLLMTRQDTRDKGACEGA